jgi:hypothetical protein
VNRLLTLWRCRWGFLRLAIAASLVWILAADTPSRLARIQLASLPDADFAAEIRQMRERGRYTEALVVADAGLETTPHGATHDAISHERELTLQQQQSTLRRLKDLARGAITGGGASTDTNAPDPSLELLVGAVATDLFVVGDIRDLVIQSGRWIRGDKTDPVIAALAGIGLVTTLAPEIDWAPSLLKATRKAGAMTDRFAQFITTAARERRIEALRTVMSDTATIARHASPAGAVRLMKHVDSAEDAARLARFLERTGARGAHALRTGGKEGLEMVRAAESLRAAGKIDDAVAVERVLLAASAKGRAGASWLARGLHRPLLRPHPLIGIAKSLWKGNAQALIARAIESLDPFSQWALPAAAAWAFLEAAMLLRRLAGTRPGQPARVAQRSRLASAA